MEHLLYIFCCTDRQTVPFAAYPRNGTSVMRGNCLYLVSGFISVEYQELFLLQLNVLQGWKPFNSAFNLMWLHTWYHWLSFLFWWICRQEGSHCKFFNLASTIKMNLNRFRSEAEIFWDQKGKLYQCESWVTVTRFLCNCDVQVPF